MAWIHQDASWIAKSRELDAEIDQWLADHFRNTKEAMDFVLPAISKVSPGLGLATRLALEMNPFLGVTLRKPMSLAGIDSIDTGFPDLDKDLGGVKRGEVTVFGGRVGVPAFMAPRDNGHRLSRADKIRYDELCVSNTYVVPERKEDRWGSPVWPDSVELVEGRHPDAGKWGKLCYRTACQAPNAFYFNKGTHKHYCQECADIIDRENMIGEKLHTLVEQEGEHA